MGTAIVVHIVVLVGRVKAGGTTGGTTDSRFWTTDSRPSAVKVVLTGRIILYDPRPLFFLHVYVLAMPTLHATHTKTINATTKLSTYVSKVVACSLTLRFTVSLSSCP